MKKHPLAYASAFAALPLAIGVVASLVWSVLGESRHIYFSMSLAWLSLIHI